MKKMIGLILAMSILLSGCSVWMNGSYSSVVPHTEPDAQVNTTAASVANYYQTKTSLISMIMNSAETAVFTILYESETDAERDMQAAIQDVCETNPYAVYAVEGIRYEMGSSNGQSAFRVQITYLQNKVDLKTIRTVKNMEDVTALIAEQLNDCSAGVVFYCESWGEKDYEQIVADYALANPHKVIEQPEITVNIYPENAMRQIIELKFNYQTSRASLRTMQSYVAVVFSSAESYVDDDAVGIDRCLQIYNFLMNRYPVYEIQTSITPAYSLLRHGVGDERAFSIVYAAMCQWLGVDCEVVTGTCGGELWTWNVVRVDGAYYHIDLLDNREKGEFYAYTGEEMFGYVWDYSQYPFTQEKILEN